MHKFSFQMTKDNVLFTFNVAYVKPGEVKGLVEKHLYELTRDGFESVEQPVEMEVKPVIFAQPVAASAPEKSTLEQSNDLASRLKKGPPAPPREETKEETLKLLGITPAHLEKEPTPAEAKAAAKKARKVATQKEADQIMSDNGKKEPGSHTFWARALDLSLLDEAQVARDKTQKKKGHDLDDQDWQELTRWVTLLGAKNLRKAVKAAIKDTHKGSYSWWPTRTSAIPLDVHGGGPHELRRSVGNGDAKDPKTHIVFAKIGGEASEVTAGYVSPRRTWDRVQNLEDAVFRFMGEAYPNEKEPVA